MCLYTRVHTETTWVLDVSPGVGRTPGKPQESDRLRRSIHVDRICVQSTFVYIYVGRRVLMIWADYVFSFIVSFPLRKVEGVTTISKFQSLTSARIIDYTLRVPNKTNALSLYEQ